MPRTPTTPDGLSQFDGEDAVAAVIKAWTEPGPHPEWHTMMQRQVKIQMPVLARALDRLADEASPSPSLISDEPVDWSKYEKPGPMPPLGRLE